MNLLPKGSAEIDATFAFLSKPAAAPCGVWKDSCLLWEYADPYLYARWVGNRVMVGGEDVRQSLERDCKPLLERKAATLKEKFHQWMPKLPLEIETAWCGVIVSTRDGVGFIGPICEGSRMLLALCYGGNGTTHGVAAAALIIDYIHGRKNADAEIFRVRRFKA